VAPKKKKKKKKREKKSQKRIAAIAGPDEPLKFERNKLFAK
jgi:hypothetical protein